jgi:hypothetical protein
MPIRFFKTDNEAAAPGWTLQCTEFMAEFINASEWKRDITGFVEKMIHHAVLNFDEPSHG